MDRFLFVSCCVWLLCSGEAARAQPTNGPAAVVASTNRTVATARMAGNTGSLDSAGTNEPVKSLSGDDYELRAGDRVSFQVLEDRDQPMSLFIADSGEMAVPCLGRVRAAGKTCRELSAFIKKELEKDYYHHATVVLGLDSANHLLGRIYVWGQVRNQGPIEITVNESLTAGKAILRCGGFGDFANKKKVKVLRPAKGREPKKVLELNMVAILEEGHIDQDIALQADDSVLVPARLINF